MAKEAHQILAWQLDSLSTRNDELQRELDVTYQEVATLRGEVPQVSRAPPRIVINHRIQMEVDVMGSSINKGIQTIAGNEA